MEGREPCFCDDATWVHGIPICRIMDAPCWRVTPCAHVKLKELEDTISECMKEGDDREASHH